jgi:hypothetical protein
MGSPFQHNPTRKGHLRSRVQAIQETARCVSRPAEDVKETLTPARRTTLSQAGHAGTAPFDDNHAHAGYWNGIDAERTIAEIECLERIFAAPDTRSLSPSDLLAANQRHDENARA